MDAPAARLIERLGLSDGELCRTLDSAPIQVISGDLDHRPELAILLALTDDALERVDPETLRRWLRTNGPAGRPLDHLLARDFGAFEQAVETLVTRGFVIGGG